jgi:hypothetical protein
VGRFITLEIEDRDAQKLRADVDAMCRRLLANPIIEDYCFELGGPGQGIQAVPDGSDVEATHDAPSPWTAADPFASRQEEVE